MNIYNVRFKKDKLKSENLNYRDIYLLPDVVIGRSDEIDLIGDVNNYVKKEATVYYIGVVWLSRAYFVEFWCDRKEVAHANNNPG